MQRQPKPLFKGPDVLTALRLPLAGAFVVVDGMAARLSIVVAAALSDVLDGLWARRIGGSRAGAVLDPVVDKLFMGTVFAVVAVSSALTVIEVLGVLLRDLTAAVAFVTTVVRGHPTALPARAGGKAVTICQILTLIAFVAGSDFLRPMAWATAAISIYAIVDYSQAARRQ